MRRLKFILIFYTTVIACLLMLLLKHDYTVLIQTRAKVWVLTEEGKVAKYIEVMPRELSHIELPNGMVIRVLVEELGFVEKEEQ